MATRGDSNCHSRARSQLGSRYLKPFRDFRTKFSLFHSRAQSRQGICS